MDNFEKLFHKLYPKTASRRIKLRSHAINYIEKLVKEQNMNPDYFDKQDELDKWNRIYEMLNDKNIKMEEIDKVVFSNIFPDFG